MIMNKLSLFVVAMLAIPSASPANMTDYRSLLIASSTTSQLLRGLTRHQVYHLLGTPQKARGIDARYWEYRFDISDVQHNRQRDCRLKLRFDKGELVNWQWSRPDCGKAAA
jgi:outer membrane protein assembly factor BamE (lipoprotein component of BamABCDE complex)